MPAALSISPLNVATPATAIALLVPVSTPSPGAPVNASATGPAKVVAVLPSTSCTMTDTLNGVLAGVVAGASPNTNLVAGFGTAVALTASGEPARLPAVTVRV